MQTLSCMNKRIEGQQVCQEHSERFKARLPRRPHQRSVDEFLKTSSLNISFMASNYVLILAHYMSILQSDTEYDRGPLLPKTAR